MKKRTILSVILCSFLITTAFAFKDTGELGGKILGTESEPLSFANVILYKSADSSLVKVEYSGEDGSFKFSNLAPGSYWINVTYVGLADYQTEPFELKTGQSVTLPDIQLVSAGVDLAEVVVKTTRPIVEVHADKTVFNVDGSINATGSDALELLRKAPGVVVDNNDNLMVSGKNGVKVYINGKPTYLSSADLAAYLKTVQSSEIDNIEIITNPSAKWDAEGNAGIINIKMKKDRRLGANGSVNLGYTRGDYNSYNSSLSGNYRNKKMNTFGRYNYSNGRSSNWFDLYREQNGLVYDQVGPMSNKHESHNFRIGNDFFLNKKNTLGFLFSGYRSDYNNLSNSRMKISQIGQTVVDSSLIARTEDPGNRSNYNFNLNYQFDDGKGVVWNFDADYGLFENTSNGLNPNEMRTGTGGNESALISEEVFRTITPTNIDIYTAKIDHERPFAKGKLSAGAKFSYVKTDNDFQFYNVIEGNDLLDEDRTNRFFYDENVNALYANYSRKEGKFSFQAGLRMEQTISEGMLEALKSVNDQEVKRDYVDYFPSGGLTYEVNEKNSLRLSYSRRIDRPSYQDLNPFEGRLDKLTFQKGNPFLRPQYSNNVQLTHTFNRMVNTSVSYSKTTDLITRLTDIDDRDPNASFITYENLANQDNYSLTISSPVTLAKWWNAYTNLNAYYTHNEADFGDGKIVDLDVYAVNLYAQNTFNLPKGFVLELSGWYSSPTIWGGNFKTKNMWSMDAGLQKKLLKDQATLKISLSDLFKSNEWYGENTLGELYLIAQGGWDSRRLRVNLTYRFGNQEVKSARRRTTGLEEEKKRVKSN